MGAKKNRRGGDAGNGGAGVLRRLARLLGYSRGKSRAAAAVHYGPNLCLASCRGSLPRLESVGGDVPTGGSALQPKDSWDGTSKF